MPLRRRSTIDILVVCTGNVCRSPYIAARLAHALPELVVGSAGTAAMVGEGVPPEIDELLDAGQVERGPHAGARLTKSLVRRASLVIAAEGMHRVEVQALAGSRDHAFTLRELARVLVAAGSPAGIGVDGVLRVAAEAVAHDDGRDYEDDLADPYGRGPEAYRAMADTADEALSVLIPALRAVPE